MRVAYITHTNISISETFISDLVTGLNEHEDLDLTYLSGAACDGGNKLSDLNINAVYTGFSSKYDLVSRILFKIGQMVGGGKENLFKMFFNRKIAEKQLKGVLNDDFDVALVDYATTGVLVYRLLSKKKIPFIVHVHGYDITSSLSDPYYVKELQKIFTLAEFIVCPSEHTKRRLVLQGCPQKKIKVIYRGIIQDNIKPLSWNERKQKDPGVVFFGRLTLKKHPVALLHAFRIVKDKIPNAYLSIIGEGPLKEQVESTIDRLSLNSCVTMYGALEQNEAFKILRNHWVYAQHSATSLDGDQEGFPFSLAEAAAHELPVVSTIHSGITENVVDRVTGYLVQEHNYETMAEKIIYLIQNPEAAERMGKQGRLRIQELCKQEKRIKMIKQLLSNIA
ncbi:glycosyltransferase [Rhodohalobacter sp. 8-1]|uniref:glycosyltransferase n=1 Tax=Rhodohalobacter sp. 8-1 TaxID=3131972 RepID=UPI0030EF1F68